MVIWDLATILNHIKQLDDKPLKLLYKHQDERTKQWKYLIKSYGSWKLEIYFFIKTPLKTTRNNVHEPPMKFTSYPENEKLALLKFYMTI